MKNPDKDPRSKKFLTEPISRGVEEADIEKVLSVAAEVPSLRLQFTEELRNQFMSLTG
jgi:hypothetical protein